MDSSKFAICYYADGMIWCQHHNGNWAPPFPAYGQKSKTSSSEEVPQESEEIASSEAKSSD
jgi:hypothetical protein